MLVEAMVLVAKRRCSMSSLEGESVSPSNEAIADAPGAIAGTFLQSSMSQPPWSLLRMQLTSAFSSRSEPTVFGKKIRVILDDLHTVLMRSRELRPWYPRPS